MLEPPPTEAFAERFLANETGDGSGNNLLHEDDPAVAVLLELLGKTHRRAPALVLV